MDTVTERPTGPKRIGELLVSANVLKPDAVIEALQVAKKSKRPLGRVLMSLGALNERELEAALELQSMLREGLVSNEFGLRALNLAVKKEMSLTEGFKKLGWQPPVRPPIVANELAALLIDANIVPRGQMDEALSQSLANRIPLGRCLVLTRIISTDILSSALTAQVLVREGRITREEAVAGLKAAFRKQQPIEQSLQEAAVLNNPPSIRVGELLTSAGFLTESDRMTAVEQGLNTHERVGQIFLRQGLISDAVLQDTLRLQELVNNKQILPEEASEILRYSHARGVSVETIFAELKAQQQDTHDAYRSLKLLVEASLLGEEDLGVEPARTVQEMYDVISVLQDSGRISSGLIEAATQVQNLVANEIITAGQAHAVLRYCHKENVDFHTSLAAAPWEIPAQAEVKKLERELDSVQKDRSLEDNKTRQTHSAKGSWLDKVFLRMKGKS
jgi:hypothetical protein